jgi:hypothetical protein
MEPWAGSRLIPLKFIEFAVLGTFGKLRLLFFYMYGVQRYIFYFTFPNVLQIIYGLITFLMQNGSTLLEITGKCEPRDH